MLIDRYLPEYDVTEVQETQVHAAPEVAYPAIFETDLRDPVVETLFALRELPARLTRRRHHETPGRAHSALTFRSLATSEMGWIALAEEPGAEFVVGAVGRFWQRDYGWHPVPADRFVGFDEPGYAKLAVSFRVQPLQGGWSIVRYEARTAATDDMARLHFRRYWRIIHPGVALVMRRALRRIRNEAERRQTVLVGAA